MTTGIHINVITPRSVTIQIKSFLLCVSCVASSKSVVLELSNMMYVAVVLLEREIVMIHKKYKNKHFKERGKCIKETKVYILENVFLLSNCVYIYNVQKTFTSYRLVQQGSIYYQ